MGILRALFSSSLQPVVKNDVRAPVELADQQPKLKLNAESTWRQLRTESNALNINDVIAYPSAQEEITRKQCMSLFKDKRYFECLYYHLMRMWFGFLSSAVYGYGVPEMDEDTFLTYWAETKVRKCLRHLKRQDAFPVIVERTKAFFAQYQARWEWISTMAEPEYARLRTAVSSADFPEPEAWQAEFDTRLGEFLRNSPQFMEYFSILSAPLTDKFFNEQLAPVLRDDSFADDSKKSDKERAWNELNKRLAQAKANDNLMTYHWAFALLYGDMCKQLYSDKRYLDCLKTHCLRMWHWRAHAAAKGFEVKPFQPQAFFDAWTEKRVRGIFKHLGEESSLDSFATRLTSILQRTDFALQQMYGISQSSSQSFSRREIEKGNYGVNQDDTDEFLEQDLRRNSGYMRVFNEIKSMDFGAIFDAELLPHLTRLASN